MSPGEEQKGPAEALTSKAKQNVEHNSAYEGRRRGGGGSGGASNPRFYASGLRVWDVGLTATVRSFRLCAEVNGVLRTPNLHPSPPELQNLSVFGRRVFADIIS